MEIRATLALKAEGLSAMKGKERRNQYESSIGLYQQHTGAY